MTKQPFWDRLNRKLFPYLGPPPLGPYNEPELPPTANKACPLCGCEMSEHSFARSVGHESTRMYCP